MLNKHFKNGIDPYDGNQISSGIKGMINDMLGKVNMPGSSSTKAKTLANSIKSMKSGSGAGSGNMFGGSGGGSGMFGSGGMPSAGGIQNMVSGILGKSGISGFGFAAFKQKGSNTMPSYIKTRQTSNLKMLYSPKLGN